MYIPNKYYSPAYKLQYSEILVSDFNLIYNKHKDQFNTNKYKTDKDPLSFQRYHYYNYTSYDIRDGLLKDDYITIYIPLMNDYLNEKLSEEIINGPFIITLYSRFNWVKYKDKRYRGYFTVKSYVNPNTRILLPFKLAKSINDGGIIDNIFSSDTFKVKIEPIDRSIEITVKENVKYYYSGFHFKTMNVPVVIMDNSIPLFNLSTLVNEKQVKYKYNSLTKNIKFYDMYKRCFYSKNDTEFVNKKYVRELTELSRPIHYDKETDNVYVPVDFFEKILRLNIYFDEMNNTLTIYLNK